MKKKKILSAIILIFFALFVVQCEKYGNRPDKAGTGDEDSDRPEWAGGGDGDNPHQNPNPSPGITKGGDYGDLYELYRTEVDGVPIMINILGEWYVQPVGENGVPLELNEDGELIDPTEATAVDFGRLNIVRSPPNVLEQAFNEAMKVLTGQGVPGRVVHNISLDFCGRLVAEYSDNGGEHVFKTIDSPRENMAIYQEAMQKLFTERLLFLDDYGFDPLTIAASCFAAGSDKTGTITKDEMLYINAFMECAGLDPIINDNDYNPEGELREYFNFSSYGFAYDRSVYENRHIQYLVDEFGFHPIDPVTGLSDGPVYNILEVFDGSQTPYYGNGSFTYRMSEVQSAVGAELFAIAMDDAVQVLEYIHEDSNIRFVDAVGNPL